MNYQQAADALRELADRLEKHQPAGGDVEVELKLCDAAKDGAE